MFSCTDNCIAPPEPCPNLTRTGGQRPSRFSAHSYSSGKAAADHCGRWMSKFLCQRVLFRKGLGSWSGTRGWPVLRLPGALQWLDWIQKKLPFTMISFPDWKVPLFKVNCTNDLGSVPSSHWPFILDTSGSIWTRKWSAKLGVFHPFVHWNFWGGVVLGYRMTRRPVTVVEFHIVILRCCARHVTALGGGARITFPCTCRNQAATVKRGGVGWGGGGVG